MRLNLSVAALVGAAFASAAGGTMAINAATDGDAPPKARSVNAQLESRFGVLRGAEAAASVKASQDGALVQETGVNPGLARAGAASGDDVAVVTPTIKGLCLGSRRFGILTCGETVQAVRGEVAGSIICSQHLPANQVVVLAALPDGVNRVTAKLSDGSTTTYAVARNTLFRHFSKSGPVPMSLSFAVDGAQRVVGTTLPDDLSC